MSGRVIGQRPPLPFRAVNRPGVAGYVPGLQRHHLIPCSLAERRCFAPLFGAVGEAPLGLDDFRRNGMLLPASESGAVRMGLPLHRGPHPDYTAIVAERLGAIEAGWAEQRRREPDRAGEAALAALADLQATLRRRLLESPRAVSLHRRDPQTGAIDFSHLDAMTATLWPDDQPEALPVSWPSAAIAA